MVAKVRPKLVTLVHNETSTGVTYPAASVGEITRRHGALFLLDTVSSLAGLDVQTDAWGVDINMTGSQKCLAMPLGLAIVSVSPRAFEAMERRARPSASYANDLIRWKRQWVPASRGGGVAEGGRRNQPVSMPTHLAQALREGGEPRPGGRHAQPDPPAPDRRQGVPGRARRAQGRSLRRPGRSRPTPSRPSACPAGWRPPPSCRRMRDAYGILISTGIEKMRETMLRVGTMGMTASPLYVLPTLSALGMAFRDLGYRAETGEALGGGPGGLRRRDSLTGGRRRRV